MPRALLIRRNFDVDDMGRSASRGRGKAVRFQGGWSRCQACRRCEWEERLAARAWVCSCGATVAQYAARQPSRPRGSRQGGGGGGQSALLKPGEALVSATEAIAGAAAEQGGEVPSELKQALLVVQQHAQAAAAKAAEPSHEDASVRRLASAKTCTGAIRGPWIRSCAVARR